MGSTGKDASELRNKHSVSMTVKSLATVASSIIIFFPPVSHYSPKAIPQFLCSLLSVLSEVQFVRILWPTQL
jgi:hypothetical protein